MRFLEMLIFKIKAMNTNLGIETFLINGCFLSRFSLETLRVKKRASISIRAVERQIFSPCKR